LNHAAAFSGNGERGSFFAPALPIQGGTFSRRPERRRAGGG
jgi:hypothetical protein